MYTIRKITLRELINNHYHIQIPSDQRKRYDVNQQDNMMFRQIRLVTGDNRKFNKYIVFVDCNGCKSRIDDIRKVLKDGFYIDDQHFVCTEKSASMSRNAILGFIDEKIEPQIHEIVSNGIKMNKTVISKYLAYRGLMFSSCFCLDGYRPKIIVVPDYQSIIPDQFIKFMVKETVEFPDKETGEVISYKNKVLKTDHRDIPIIPFDGTGIHHPLITAELHELLGCDEVPTSVMWRAPYIKGVTHEFNYTDFLSSRGVEEITDIWGEKHSVYQPMIIMTESMYKGYKYYCNTGTIDDWNYYWEQFEKYNHCLGIAKWNNDFENEPLYTKANYQILQDLDLPYDDFLDLTDYSLTWIDKIMNGDPIYTYCFLGLFADRANATNSNMAAILKNPEMLKDEHVRKYLNASLKKNMDDMKCGKLWMKATFRILVPDLIMLAEWIGGLEPKGVLESDEFWSQSVEGVCEGEWLIERNPHICRSEHVILKGKNCELIEKYCSHLKGVTMVNSKSIVCQRLNGADYDGDLVLTLQNDTMLKGVHRDLPAVMDTEDKITVDPVEINQDNIIQSIINAMDNRIGEYSNVASGYHNKCPKSKEQKERYMNNVDMVSILNAKEIDAAKTGYHENMPPFIAKYSKPLPYFMKYAGQYYSTLNKLSKSLSNMNRLCMDLERYFRKYRFKHKDRDFDYTIMQNPNVTVDENSANYIDLENLFLDFCREIQQIKLNNNLSVWNPNYENVFGDLSKKELSMTTINWNYYYEKYRVAARNIIKDQSELATYVVDICYRKFTKKPKTFAWAVAEQGIIQNIKPVPVLLPIKDPDGKYEYLGKHYTLKEYTC